MGLGKNFTQTIKSELDANKTYEIAKKVCFDSKLNIKEDSKSDESFKISASEPMKWLSTNWPNNIQIEGELFEGKVIVKVLATSKGTSITQDKNISDFLNNFVNSLKVYLG